MILRTHHDAQFFVAPNGAFAGNGLSFAARGMLGYLLSRPTSWQVQVADLQREGNIGRDMVYTLLGELRAAGYVVRRVGKDVSGQWAGTEYLVFDIPRPAAAVPMPAEPTDSDGRNPRLPDLPYTVKPDAYKGPSTAQRTEHPTAVAVTATAGGRPLRDDQLMFSTLCTAYHLAPSGLTGQQRGKLNAWVRKWREDGVTPDQLAQAVQVYLDTWKGQQGTVPSKADLDLAISQVRSGAVPQQVEAAARNEQAWERLQERVAERASPAVLAWAPVRQALDLCLMQTQVQQWVVPLVPVELDTQGTLHLRAPAAVAEWWLQPRAMDLLAVARMTAGVPDLALVIEGVDKRSAESGG